MPQFVLNFIGGKYQGGHFSLPSSGEVTFGRTAEAEIMLVEDLVSRRHARLEVRGTTLTLHDLQSTNGTFVNGERVKSAVLSAGDRVLIGSAVIQVVQADLGELPATMSEETVAGIPRPELLNRLRPPQGNKP